MVQLQLDDGNVFWEISAGVRNAHVEAGQTATLALCFDYHRSLLFNTG